MTSFIKSYIKKFSESLKKIQSIIKFKNMDASNEIQEPNAKKQKFDPEIKTREFPYQKKKVAMLLMYSGKGYLGMQRNPGFKTIEGDLLEALVKSGVVRPDHIEQPGPKMAFQRAARTDKGVSAAGQVVSLKMFVDVENAVEKINQHLPAQIQVVGLVKVTKGFDSKKCCDARTYSYVTPTFAFAPMAENVTESYRITEKVLKEVQEILNRFLGTHRFHNFTSGKKHDDPSAKRYIKEFKIGSPFIQDSLEYVKLTIKGQSFMIHHIRKMTGLTMAIMRGYANLNSLEQCWLPDKVDVPKAPSLGLMLEKLHYDFYNKKFGSDGMHELLSWDKYHDAVEQFKYKYIYPTLFHGEKFEKSMFNWLTTLALHTYDVSTGPGRSPMSRSTYLAEGFKNSPLDPTSSKSNMDSLNSDLHTTNMSSDTKNPPSNADVDRSRCITSILYEPNICESNQNSASSRPMIDCNIISIPGSCSSNSINSGFDTAYTKHSNTAVKVVNSTNVIRNSEIVDRNYSNCDSNIIILNNSNSATNADILLNSNSATNVENSDYSNSPTNADNLNDSNSY